MTNLQNFIVAVILDDAKAIYTKVLLSQLPSCRADVHENGDADGIRSCAPPFTLNRPHEAFEFGGTALPGQTYERAAYGIAASGGNAERIMSVSTL